MGQVTDPNLEGFSDEAFQPPGEDGLTTQQLAVRLQAKREQAAQDAGWVTPPQPDAPLDEVDTDEDATGPELVEDEPEAPPEQEEPEEPEEPVEGQEPPEEPEAERDEFYLSSYRTRDAAEEALAEKDRTIDRLFKELHEREEVVEEPVGQEQLDIAAWNEWAQQAVEQGAGVAGAMEALQQGGPQGFNIYLGHWVTDPDQAAEALAFNNEVQQQLATQNAIAAVSPLFSEYQERNAVDEATTAKANVAARHEDFGDYEAEMDRIVREDGVLPDGTKRWLAEIADASAEGKERAWEYLYMAAVASTAPQRRRQKTAERQRRKAASDAAKVQATVSSSEATSVSTPLNEDELKVVRKKNAIRAKLGQPLIPEE